MNARELHDWLHAAIARNDSGAQASITVPNGDWRTILSALALLAAAEANDGTTKETDAAEMRYEVGFRDAFTDMRNMECSRNGLAAEVVRLTEDAERYRWLRDKIRPIYRQRDGGASIVEWYIDGQTIAKTVVDDTNDVDAAIDSARAAP